MEYIIDDFKLSAESFLSLAQKVWPGDQKNFMKRTAVEKVCSGMKLGKGDDDED